MAFLGNILGTERDMTLKHFLKCDHFAFLGGFVLFIPFGSRHVRVFKFVAQKGVPQGKFWRTFLGLLWPMYYRKKFPDLLHNLVHSMSDVTSYPLLIANKKCDTYFVLIKQYVLLKNRFISIFFSFKFL